MTTSEDADDIVTPDDVAVLNRAVVDRAAVIASLAGTALVVVAAVAVAGWAWLAVRMQVTADDATAYTAGVTEDVTFAQRVDLFAGTLQYLVFAGLVLGAGFGLRLAADYTRARTGGSLTGVQPGDALSDPVVEDYASPAAGA